MDSSTKTKLNVPEEDVKNLDYKDNCTKEDEYSCNECIKMTIVLMKHQIKFHQISDIDEHNKILKTLLNITDTDSHELNHEIITKITSHVKLIRETIFIQEIQNPASKSIKQNQKSRKIKNAFEETSNAIVSSNKICNESYKPSQLLCRKRQVINNFHCEICGNTFSQKKSLIRHKRTIHSIEHQRNNTNRAEKGSLQCDICSKVFASKRLISNHFYYDHNAKQSCDKYVCDMCGRKYASKYTIRTHLLGHIGIKEYKCGYGCSNESFLHLSGLKRHYQLKHLSVVNGDVGGGDDKIALCDFCGRDFGENAKLKRHLERHHNPMRSVFNCSICTKQYKSKESLRDHMFTHTGEKPYRCSQDGCEQGFAHRGGLNQHIRHHHKPLPNYQCDVCDKVFTLKHSFVNHQRIHTGDRPFSCSFCNLCFGSKKTLVNHQMRHTGHRRHYCDRCNKGFITFRELKLHKTRNKTCQLLAMQNATINNKH